MLDETIYWTANVRGQIWYDLILAPEDIIRRVSNILYYTDSTFWILIRGNETTLNELKIWAKASRHCYRYSPGKNSCAIKCADITGKWNKWEDVPWIAIILKKAYDDGDRTISVKYTEDKMVKNKLCNLNFI